jgi:hypothetical protein
VSPTIGLASEEAAGGQTRFVYRNFVGGTLERQD